ncbi:MAG TPA: GNAT family N-acetyltransferase [Candidatus Thermoplasmatota archaeon]
MTGGAAASRTVRLLEPRDFPFAVALTDTERWGFTAADFARCLAIAPDGCFLVEEGGERAGILTTAPYGEVAWVGNIIVAPARRGRGLGAAVIQHALDYLDARGARAVRLWAYEGTANLYTKFGFARDGPTSRRWIGFGHAEHEMPPAVVPPGCHAFPVNALTVRDLLPFDRARFGSDRSAVLSLVAAEAPHAGFVARDGRGDVVGFLLTTPSPKGCEVGPWLVDPAHIEWAAPLLLERALGILAGQSVELGVYDARTDVQQLLDAHGFHPGFQTARMTRGDPAAGRDAIESVCAIGSLERG